MVGTERCYLLETVPLFQTDRQPAYDEDTLMNSRTQDVNLLKMALIPAVIMTVVVGILFILVTNISAMVAVDTPRAAAPLTTMDATLAHRPSTSTATSQGG